MKFGVALPLGRIDPGEFQTGEAIRQMAQTAERVGIDAACTSEHPAPDAEWLRNDPAGHDCADPFTGLAFAAAATTKLLIFTNILILPFRNPFMTAKAAATFQAFSDGRFILGVGTGYQKAEFDALGVPYKERGALTDEALDTIREIWSGETVVRKGRHFDAPGNLARPAPSPTPPIWVGGGSDKAVERAARIGDGWLPHFTYGTNDPVVMKSSVVSIPHFAEKIARIKELREQNGRTGPFEIAPGSPFRPKSRTPDDEAKLLESMHECAGAGATFFWTTVPAPSRAGFLESLAWYGDLIARFKKG